MSMRVSIAMLAVLAAAPAQAQRVPCGDGAEMIAHAEKEWGEDVQTIALDAAGRLVRVLVNPETGTWTMLLTSAGGRTCLIHHGTAWETIPPAPDPGDPS